MIFAFIDLQETHKAYLPRRYTDHFKQYLHQTRQHQCKADISFFELSVMKLRF